MVRGSVFAARAREGDLVGHHTEDRPCGEIDRGRGLTSPPYTLQILEEALSSDLATEVNRDQRSLSVVRPDFPSCHKERGAVGAAGPTCPQWLELADARWSGA